jgi:4-amino-4-deoxy-L-arabinose transferase-like glycosyltransferase
MSRVDESKQDRLMCEKWYPWWIAAAASVIFFTSLGGAALWDMDEALYTSCARDMVERDDWVVPWFNGAMFPEKPPLMFWSMIAGFEIFGVNEFGARFFSAVFGVMTAVLTYYLGRRLCNARVGFWAGLATASTIIFTISARAATVDSALTLVTTGAMFFLVLGLPSLGNAKFPLRYAVPMYACVGVAVLGKGPVGMVLPLAAMGLYLIVLDGWRNTLRSAWWMRPFTAIVVIAAVAVPWYAMVSYRTDGEWVRQFLWEYNLRPFKQPILSHGDTSFLSATLAVVVAILYYFYHIPSVLVGFFPWSVFLGPVAFDTVDRIRRRDAWRNSCLLAVCWFGVWFLFWSICKTKLPHYLLPAYPALGLLTGCFIDRWQTQPASVKPWELRNAWFSMMLVGIALMIAVPIAMHILMPGEEILGLLGIVPLIGGWLCWRQASQGRHAQALTAFAVMAVVCLTGMFGWGSLRVDRHQNSRPMIAAIEADSGSNDAPIASYRFFRESMVYYAGHPVAKCNDDGGRAAPEKLREFLAKPRPSYVVTITNQLPDIAKEYAGQYEEIFRQPCFGVYGRELVVLKFK